LLLVAISPCLQVLCFYAVWDDRSGLYGDRRPYVVHYYLEDDTVEINEVRKLHTTWLQNCAEHDMQTWQAQAMLMTLVSTTEQDKQSCEQPKAVP
jgi:hypothetical protein